MKPAYEPIILARKPGPMRELGIEECRVAYEDNARHEKGGSYATRNNKHAIFGHDLDQATEPSPSGRWPANLVLECTCDETREGTVKGSTPASGPTLTGESSSVARGKFKGVEATPCYSGPNGKEPVRIHTDPNCPCAMLDGQTGTKKSPKPYQYQGKDEDGSRVAYHPGLGYGVNHDGEYGDSGCASRFFYAPKASRAERGEGNTHPTVKSLALMRWLVRLVARPGDVVLDPFMGSGTTGVACVEEGREFIGIEREAEYVEIARRRIAHASAQGRLPLDESPPLPPVAGRPT